MSYRPRNTSEAIGEAVGKGIVKLIGYIFRLLWQGVKAIFNAISQASDRKSRAIYAPPVQTSGDESKSNTPPPLTTTNVQPSLPEQPETDERFTESDAQVNAGKFPEALDALARVAAGGDLSNDLKFKQAHRYLGIWKNWSEAWPRPEPKDFPEFDDCIAASRQRNKTLRESLTCGVEHIEAVLATDPHFLNARLLGRELSVALASNFRNGSEPTRGYQFQRRAIELTDPPLDYDTYDMADMLASEGQCFGDFFDLSENLFKQGLLEPHVHFKAALSCVSAVTSDKYALSAADRPREQEFLKAALGHLEYDERHGLETGPLWHNEMAQVLALLGNLNEAIRHFEIFKILAAKTEPEDQGKATISMLGGKTVKLLRACQERQS